MIISQRSIVEITASIVYRTISQGHKLKFEPKITFISWKLINPDLKQ